MTVLCVLYVIKTICSSFSSNNFNAGHELGSNIAQNYFIIYSASLSIVFTTNSNRKRYKLRMLSEKYWNRSFDCWILKILKERKERHRLWLLFINSNKITHVKWKRSNVIYDFRNVKIDNKLCLSGLIQKRKTWYQII